MSVFTEAEVVFLRSQRLARIATASTSGQPDVAAVGFSLDGDTLVTGGYDLTKTVRYRFLQANPRAVIVIDDLASVDPWQPRGIKVRGAASLEESDRGLVTRIVPEVIWSWYINTDAEKRFMGVERRAVAL